MIGNKICNFITLYRPPSQNQYDFQAFIDNPEINLRTLAQKNPFLRILTGKMYRQTKLERLQKVRILVFRLLVHQISSS